MSVECIHAPALAPLPRFDRVRCITILARKELRDAIRQKLPLQVRSVGAVEIGAGVGSEEAGAGLQLPQGVAALLLLAALQQQCPDDGGVEQDEDHESRVDLVEDPRAQPAHPLASRKR